MCEPISLAIAATAAAVGAGSSIQQGVQSKKAAKTQQRSQINFANRQEARSTRKRQEGVLQQELEQSQLAKKSQTQRTQALARFNLKNKPAPSPSNILGANALAGTSNDKLGIA